MEEKVAYVWSINARWTQLNEKGERDDDGTGFYKGFPEAKTELEILQYAQEWWHKYSANDKFIGKLPELIKLEVKFKGEQTWWLEWFNHCSFNVFESESKAFESFEKFLRSKDVSIRYTSIEADLSFDKDGYCAMGANDRWRWELCTCEHCKKQKVTRIRH